MSPTNSTLDSKFGNSIKKMILFSTNDAEIIVGIHIGEINLDPYLMP